MTRYRQRATVDQIGDDHDLAAFRRVDAPRVGVGAVGHLVQAGDGSSRFMRRVFIAGNRLIRFQRSFGAREPVARRLRDGRHRLRDLRHRSEDGLELANVNVIALVRRLHGLQRIRIFALSMCTSVTAFAAQTLAYVGLPFLLLEAYGRTAPT